MSATLRAPAALSRRGLLLGVAAMAAPLAARSMPTAAASRESRPLMGTRVDVTVVDADPARRAAALAAAWRRMETAAARWSRFDPDSELSRIAAAADAATGADAAGPRGLRTGVGLGIAVDPATAALLQRARRCAEFTDGCFDPTVGAYADWDFGDRTARRVPSAQRLAEQRRRVGFGHLHVDVAAARVRLARPGMRLDLGGFAKLPVLALGLQALREHGIASALVNGGGDVLATTAAGHPAWRVGVRDPAEPQRLRGVVELRDGVVASSGDYERCFVDAAGRRQHHVLDPRTGRPSRGLHGVTLVAHDVDAVDGLGAAIMVGGTRRAASWLAARPGVDALAVGADGAWFAGRMADRLRSA